MVGHDTSDDEATPESAGASSVTGVVGEGGLADAVATSLRDAGGQPHVGSVADVLAADPDVVVAVGESALLSVARRAPDVPVVPVDAGRGFESVPRSAADAVGDAVVAGDWTVRATPLFDVTAGDVHARALTDVTAVTAKSGRISEYSVTSTAPDGSRLPVTRVRADGVVVATPAGSHGYARDAGGAVLSPGIEGAVVVPIGPFTVDQSHWVVRPPVTVTVEREGVVALYADDREVATLSRDEEATVTFDGHVDLVRLPASRPVFDTR
ncbi:ATP-NAD kinase [Halobacteriaceae archaeon GCM10025711]